MLVFHLLSVFLFISFVSSTIIRPLLLRWSSSLLCLRLNSTLRLASRVAALERSSALPIAHIYLRPPLAGMD